MRKLILTIFLFGLLYSCLDQKANNSQKPILVAQREAPIGWIWLNLYPDSTFEYLSGGKREKIKYAGNYKIESDTIIFNYTDSIPLVGSKAFISHSDILYLNGRNKEKLNIVINEIKVTKK